MFEIPQKEFFDQLVDHERAVIVLESPSHFEARRWLSVALRQGGLVEERTIRTLEPTHSPEKHDGRVRIGQTLTFDVGQAVDGRIAVHQEFELAPSASGPALGPPRAAPPIATQTHRQLWVHGTNALLRAREVVAKLDPKLGRAWACTAYKVPQGAAAQRYACDPFTVDIRSRSKNGLPKKLDEWLEVERGQELLAGKWLTARFKKPLGDPYAFAHVFYDAVRDDADLGFRSIPLILPLAGVVPPDHFYPPGAAASDPYQKIYLDAIRAEDMWGNVQARTRSRVRIFLLDVGVYNCQDAEVDTTLSTSVVGVTVSSPPYSASPAPLLGVSDPSHGTKMTALMGAGWSTGGGSGIAGICGAFSEISVAEVTCSSLTEIALAIDYAVWALAHAPSPTKGVIVIGHDVLQMCHDATSLIGFRAEVCKLQDSITRAEAAGPDCLVVLPAGNCDVPGTPKTIPTDLAIGAATLVVGSTSDAPAGVRSRWSGSRMGGAGVNPSLLAPGAGVYTLVTPSNYGSMWGTSYAAAHVAGVAALMRSVNPGLSAAQVAGAITSHVTPAGLPVEQCGAGCLDGFAAVSAV